MGLTPSAIGALGQGLGGTLKSIVGLVQQHRANKLLSGLQYPTETLPDEYTNNQNLAQVMASTGLPSEQYNLAMKNIQRQQLSAIRASNDRRGGLMSIPGIQNATDNATLSLDAQNAAQRISNQRNLMAVNSQVAGVKRDIFNKNVRDRYLRDYNYAMGLKGMGNQNLYGGLDQIAGAGVDYANANRPYNAYSGYGNRFQQTGTGYLPPTE